MKQILIFTIVIFSCSIARAQSEYEPSLKNPFGLPNPTAPIEVKDYQPLIGICDCESYRLGKEGEWLPPVKMTWEFKYIMNGMAVQDQTIKDDNVHSGSIRQYNSDSAKWYVHYYSSAAATPSLGTWQGGKKGNDIILYKNQPSPSGADGFYKITFHSISSKGFQWLGEWVNEGESIKFPTWKIDCKKR